MTAPSPAGETMRRNRPPQTWPWSFTGE
ncbi:hypothetical protein IQ26_01382 [Mesorhizobium tianshanense]|uniref:Uncharacterized protein n=1 Tax=Mesorhizobium tianshanense TaxID=39844 RepID=A0A562P7G6_9HYPH|nr:hypothetical protein IQ26_01382 [Mesorhizobium tianshanense]